MHPSFNISDFPPELLEEIFSYVVSYYSDQVTITSLTYRSTESPFSISHVCARWRSLALNLPHLWSHIFVIKPANNGMGNLVGEWISRAGSHPLHLSLRAGYASNTRPTAALAVLKVYMASISHCLSFEVQFHHLRLSDYLNSSIIRPRHLSLLETLSITSDDPYDPEAIYFVPLLHARNLRSATWIGMDYLLLDKPGRFWINLQELTLGSAQVLTPLLSVISHCQRLKRLTLCKRITCVQDNDPTITLPQLTYLHAPFEHAQLLGIFDCLITPSLKELEVLAGNQVRWRRIATFIERSAATLEILKLHQLNQSAFDEQQFLETLQMPCFQNLKELESTFPITIYTIIFLTLPTPTLQTEHDPGFTIPSNHVAYNHGRGHLRHLVRLSLTLSRKCRPILSTDLSSLVISRGGSVGGRVMAEFFNGWETESACSEGVTCVGGNTEVTFRWQEMYG